MKILFLAATVVSTLFSFAQHDSIGKLRGENILGIAFELGGSVDHARDVMIYGLSTTIEKHPSFGFTGFYEHQFRFNRRNGLILGVGLNATLFSTHLVFENPDTKTVVQTNDEYYSTETNTKPHDLGRDQQAYFSIELPILYVRTFEVKNNWSISPFVGVKFRNVAYVTGEYRNKGFANGTFEGEPGDTTFFMYNSYRSDTYRSRIIALPTIGVKVSKTLPNNGKLNFFADYSYGLFNHVEVRYSNFDNTEKVEMIHNDNGTITTTHEMRKYDFMSDGWGAVLALNMSHFRTGISYTLPNR